MVIRMFSLLTLLLTSLSITVANPIDNFWKGIDFSDTTLIKSHDMERHFVKFLKATEETGNKSTAFTYLLNKASLNPANFSCICDLAEKYLFDETSELYNEETYLLFLESVLSNTNAPQECSVRADFYASELQKNIPGKAASDFGFELSNGMNSSLYQTEVQSELLVMFYDPDCEHCAEAVDGLKNSPFFEEQVRKGNLAVIAVCVSGNKEIWLESLMQMPSQWICAYASTEIDDIYFLKTIPAFYLLSKEKKIIRRNITYTRLKSMYLR